MQSPPILVTGGAGFIGGVTVLKLLDAGHSVYAIDRQMPTTLLQESGAKWLTGDFSGEVSLESIRMFRPDAIIHCAGTSLVGPSMTDPSEYYNNNVSKTIKFMDFVKDLPKKPIIMFSSSASVYGEPDVLPLKEYDEVKPISPYGSTKATCELILRDYSNAYGIDTVCFRYFNAAGAEPVNFDLGQEPEATHIVARVLEASIAGRAFTINGGDYDTEDGTCIRDYVHVWDIARAHVLGASYMLDDYPQAGAHIYNLGTGHGTSNTEIVNYVNDQYKLPFVNYGPRRAGDPATLVASAQRALYHLTWEPLFSDTATIIDSAYCWYKNGV